MLQADVKYQNGKMLPVPGAAVNQCVMKEAFTSVVMVKENSDSSRGILMIELSRHNPVCLHIWTLIVNNDIYSAYSYFLWLGNG